MSAHFIVVFQMRILVDIEEFLFGGLSRSLFLLSCD